MQFDRKPLPDIVIEVFPFKPVAPTVNVPKQRGRPPLPVPAVDDPRLHIVETWLASESLKPNSRKAYARELKRFLVWSDRALEEFTQADIALYKDDLKSVKAEDGETSVNSVNVALTALRSFFNWYCAQAIEVGQSARVNPTLGVKFERVPLPPPKDVSQTALEWLNTALEYTQETQSRDRAMVQVLCHGLRAGELVSLNVGSYDGRRLHIAHTKTNEPRTVPLCDAGRSALNQYLEGRAIDGETLTPERPLMHSLSRSERLSYHGVYQAVKRLGMLAAQLSLKDWLSQQSEEARHVREGVQALNAESLLSLAPVLPYGVWAVASELVQLHPHQLRHTYATGLFRQGLDPTHARRLLGHSSEQTTRRYTQAVEAEAAEAAYYRLIGETVE
ncbi:tyrosine-type recombinase/integrase [Phormidium sp. FACHB-592]|uniref:Tyrosine-type recombinase/integrase n=1 Tax=Stenomitos frigidus AS-A4 TaxID=2933935 RepID=A0ABV0KTB7_9CYAN|nr:MULTISPECIES: tyrosine-type recombinase/integrase [Cyanophyceae]MBD2034499.1 tyrosine-type recombinase/integrase [Leptolyngbya sp. FACHB-321]MBD2078253.1 tyrosine-type recombinase/integrase [Phormidium sp. FACHB-592]